MNTQVEYIRVQTCAGWLATVATVGDGDAPEVCDTFAWDSEREEEELGR